MKNSILIIDDNNLVRDMLRDVFEYYNYITLEASSGQSGIDIYKENPTDIVITDIIMPGMNGIEVIRKLKAEFPSVKIIAISGGSKNTYDTLASAKQSGASHTFIKPFDMKEILSVIHKEING